LANEKEDYPHEGIVDFVNNRINAATGTLQVRAVVANPLPTGGGPRLLTPGLFVRVRLTAGDAHQALVVPQSAIGTDQARKFVLVVNAKNTVEYRPVEAGPIQPDGRQVVEPLKIVTGPEGARAAHEGEAGEDSIRPGERVIVTGMQRIRPGMPVETKPYIAGGVQ
jgi:multidrug efflux system membrane fusion protein